MSDEKLHLFIRWFMKRIFSKNSIIDDSVLPAGSAMHFYCDHCGAISDTRSENYISTPIKVCEECQKLIDLGLMVQAITDAEKEALKRFEELDETERKWLKLLIDGDILRAWQKNSVELKISSVHNKWTGTQTRAREIIQKLEKLGFIFSIKYYHCLDYIASKGAELLK